MPICFYALQGVNKLPQSKPKMRLLLFLFAKLLNAEIIVLNPLDPSFLEKIRQGDFAAIARGISVVENERPGSAYLLQQLNPQSTARVVGITGPPGAGKSTLINALLRFWSEQGKRIAVLSVDPSSPFNFGALLGDRIRMSEFYLNPNVYIRSLASRGALGGLNAKIIEITDLLRESNFDYIVVETVGVGQSEVEIAGLADTTLVVMVPEAGDEVQTLKAGIMEIADVFVVNKGDREQADEFVKNLKALSHSKAGNWSIPVIKCVAVQHQGIAQVAEAINQHQAYTEGHPERRIAMYTEKAYQLIQEKRMHSIHKKDLAEQIRTQLQNGTFQLFRFVDGIE